MKVCQRCKEVGAESCTCLRAGRGVMTPRESAESLFVPMDFCVADAHNERGLGGPPGCYRVPRHACRSCVEAAIDAEEKS